MDPDALATLTFWLGLAVHCFGSPIGVPVARAARAWVTIEPSDPEQATSLLVSATPLVVVDRRNPRGRTVCAVSLRVPEARPGLKTLCGVQLRDGDGNVVLRGDVPTRAVTQGVAVVHVDGACAQGLAAMAGARPCPAPTNRNGEAPR